MSRIKILSGWSNVGGSTTAFINLCNLLNREGYDCTFYGPHDWHLDKCKSGKLEQCPVNEEGERLIVHFLKFPSRPEESKKVILSCHEKELYSVKHTKSFWDDIVFVSDTQKDWHETSGIVIPNITPVIMRSVRSEEGPRVAGIIGSIDRNKRTHVSIKRALDDGFEKIKLFGLIVDNLYWEEEVHPLVDGDRVVFEEYSDKNNMYSQVDEVYLSSASECASLVATECYSLGIPFHGNENIDPVTEVLSSQEIFSKWVGVLGLEKGNDNR